MSSYEVNFEVIVKSFSSAVVFVEADSEEEAIQMAEEAMRNGEWHELFEGDSDIESYQLDSIHEED